MKKVKLKKENLNALLLGDDPEKKCVQLRI